ncbi:MAG: hypothetical protein WC503_02155 [Candidatus Shapirobacteria bacterium]
MTNKGKEQTSLPSVEKRPSVVGGLDWDDLLFLGEQNLALRHVTNLSDAKREVAEGIRGGDAVSLSAPINFVEAEMLPDIENIENYPLWAISEMLSDDQRQQVINSFEEAIQNFIRDGVGFDLNSFSENVTTREVVEDLFNNKLAFLMAKFQGAKYPYDIDGYYQLGKCGKQVVPPENVVAGIDLENEMDQVFSDLGFSEDELISGLSQEKFDKIREVCTPKIWKKVVLTIKAEKDNSK